MSEATRTSTGPAAAPAPSVAAERSQVLWGLDAAADIRFSHENPDVQACYSEFLGEPLSPLAEELLHTDHHAWTMPNEGTC